MLMINRERSVSYRFAGDFGYLTGRIATVEGESSGSHNLVASNVHFRNRCDGAVLRVPAGVRQDLRSSDDLPDCCSRGFSVHLPSRGDDPT
jgi:hypothetical protein